MMPDGHTESHAPCDVELTMHETAAPAFRVAVGTVYPRILHSTHMLWLACGPTLPTDTAVNIHCMHYTLRPSPVSPLRGVGLIGGRDLSDDDCRHLQRPFCTCESSPARSQSHTSTCTWTWTMDLDMYKSVQAKASVAR